MTKQFTDMHGKIAMSVTLIPRMMKVIPGVSDFQIFEDDVESLDLLEEQKEKPGNIESTYDKPVFCQGRPLAAPLALKKHMAQKKSHRCAPNSWGLIFYLAIKY